MVKKSKVEKSVIKEVKDGIKDYMKSSSNNARQYVNRLFRDNSQDPNIGVYVMQFRRYIRALHLYAKAEGELTKARLKFGEARQDLERLVGIIDEE
ncbi:hypothetical protein HY212_03405 [Candidatus Pacearchaeota archaeon]|nr:hypothetical protein [Candidatus Pacearchaeota archaeon]